jgi:hypothetical protein
MDCDGHERVQAILFAAVIGSVVAERVVGRGGDWHECVAWRRRRRLDGLDIRQCFCRLEVLVLERI